jgi:hypothetical protein
LGRLYEREAVRAPLAWAKNFGNWHGQLKGVRRHPRLRHMVSPRANPIANVAAVRVPPVVTRTGRRQFSGEDKRHIVEKTCLPGGSPSVVARRYGIDLRLLFRWRRAPGLAEDTECASLCCVSGGRDPIQRRSGWPASCWEGMNAAGDGDGVRPSLYEQSDADLVAEPEDVLLRPRTMRRSTTGAPGFPGRSGSPPPAHGQAWQVRSRVGSARSCPLGRSLWSTQ